MDEKPNFKRTSILGGSEMKRSDSELGFLEFLASEEGRKVLHRDEIFGGSESRHAVFALENQVVTNLN